MGFDEQILPMNGEPKAVHIPLTAFFLSSVILFSGSGFAAVYWEDDFEIPITQAGRWVYSQKAWCANNPPSVIPCPDLGISTDVAHSGTHSLKLVYDTAFPDNLFDVAISRAIPQTGSTTAISTLFSRFYYRSHASTSEPVIILFKQADLTHYSPTTIVKPIVVNASNVFAIGVQNGEACDFILGAYGECASNWIADPNMGIAKLIDDQWYCIETETRVNNPHSLFNLWVNGVWTIHHSDLELRGMPVSGTYDNPSFSGFNVIQLYKQAGDKGNGVVYFDQLAVGPNRIGCAETLTVNPVNPGMLNWTESSTNITGFKIYRGQDSQCASAAPLPVLTTVASMTTSYTDNAIPSSATIICYEITAYNSLGESGRSNRARK